MNFKEFRIRQISQFAFRIRTLSRANVWLKPKTSSFAEYFSSLKFRQGTYQCGEENTNGELEHWRENRSTKEIRKPKSSIVFEHQKELEIRVSNSIRTPKKTVKVRKNGTLTQTSAYLNTSTIDRWIVWQTCSIDEFLLRIKPSWEGDWDENRLGPNH